MFVDSDTNAFHYSTNIAYLVNLNLDSDLTRKKCVLIFSFPINHDFKVYLSMIELIDLK